MFSHVGNMSSDFYMGLNDDVVSERPVTVMQAILSMKVLEPERWNDMAQEVFGIPGHMLTEDEVLDQIMEVDTVTTLTPPVEVWIDSEGYYTLAVWDEEQD